MKNILVYVNKNNAVLLEGDNKIPQNILNNLKKNNLEPLDNSKIYMNNYWISNLFNFILCKNIIDNKIYFYIMNNKNEFIGIVSNKSKEDNINSKYCCYFVYNNIGYYIIHRVLVLFPQFIIHMNTKEEFEKDKKEETINLLLNKI